MANESMGLIGRKLGMTQLFSDDGTVTAVTVIEAAGNTVLQVKTADSADGYNAIQLGLGDLPAPHLGLLDHAVDVVDAHEGGVGQALGETVGEAGNFDADPGTGIAFQIDVEDAVGVAHQIQSITPSLEKEEL